MKESARITHGYKCSLLSLGLLLILINVLGFLAIVVCFLADRVGNVASVRARPPPSRRENRCGDCGCQALKMRTRLYSAGTSGRCSGFAAFVALRGLRYMKGFGGLPASEWASATISP